MFTTRSLMGCSPPSRLRIRAGYFTLSFAIHPKMDVVTNSEDVELREALESRFRQLFFKGLELRAIPNLEIVKNF